MCRKGIPQGASSARRCSGGREHRSRFEEAEHSAARPTFWPDSARRAQSALGFKTRVAGLPLPSLQEIFTTDQHRPVSLQATLPLAGPRASLWGGMRRRRFRFSGQDPTRKRELV